MHYFSYVWTLYYKYSEIPIQNAEFLWLGCLLHLFLLLEVNSQLIHFYTWNVSITLTFSKTKQILHENAIVTLYKPNSGIFRFEIFLLVKSESGAKQLFQAITSSERTKKEYWWPRSEGRKTSDFKAGKGSGIFSHSTDHTERKQSHGWW